MGSHWTNADRRWCGSRIHCYRFRVRDRGWHRCDRIRRCACDYRIRAIPSRRLRYQDWQTSAHWYWQPCRGNKRNCLFNCLDPCARTSTVRSVNSSVLARLTRFSGLTVSPIVARPDVSAVSERELVPICHPS